MAPGWAISGTGRVVPTYRGGPAQRIRFSATFGGPSSPGKMEGATDCNLKYLKSHKTADCRRQTAGSRCEVRKRPSRLLLAIEQVRTGCSSLPLLSVAVRKPKTRIQNPNRESLSSFSMAVAFQLQHELALGLALGGVGESDWDTI